MSKVFISHNFRDTRHRKHLVPIAELLRKEGLVVSYVEPEPAEPLQKDPRTWRGLLKFITHRSKKYNDLESKLSRFPKLKPILVSLRNFLQRNLETSDTILYLVPSNAFTSSREDIIAEVLYRVQLAFFVMFLGHYIIMFWGFSSSIGLHKALSKSGAVQSALWSYVRARIDAAKEKVERHVFSLWMSVEDRQVDTIFRHGQRLQRYAQADKLIAEALGGVLKPKGVQKPLETREDRQLLSSPLRYTRSTLVYRSVYGIELPSAPSILRQGAQISWQEWELEAAEALGLNIVKVALLKDGLDPFSPPKDVVPVYIDHLEYDLKNRVLPGLKKSRRKPLRVRPEFFNRLLISRIVTDLLVALLGVLLIGVIAALIYGIAAFF